MSLRSALLNAIVKADEALDPAAFVAVLTPDAAFRIGSAPPLHGRVAAEEAVRRFFGRISELRHDIQQVWELEGDGRHLDLPYANVLRLAGNLVSDYRIYIDLAPLST